VRVRDICAAGVVFSVALLGCSGTGVNPRVATRLNEDAAVRGEIPSNPMRGRVITSWINRGDTTMSTMFGNDVAVGYAKTSAERDYPAGTVLSVVTWSQQEDPRWFGGKIPARVKMVEFVRVAGPGAYAYERYEGSPLKKVIDASDSAGRAAYLLSQRASVMPF
jgi:hypothetical protein